jgi:hypothetical protein
LQEKSSTSKRKTSRFFPILIFFILFIVAISITSLIFTLPILDPNSRYIAILVIGTCLLALIGMSYIFYKYETRKAFIKPIQFIPCHRSLIWLGQEFYFCIRCIGFYAGAIFWGAITTIKISFWNDLLIHIGLTYYFIILIIVVLSVPIHAARTRKRVSKTKRDDILRSLTGFIFSLSWFLIAGLIICFLY